MDNKNVPGIIKRIEELSWNYSEKNFKNIAGDIVEVSVEALRKVNEFEIGIRAELWEKCSVVKLDFDEINLQVELRQKNVYYELSLLFYNVGLVSYTHRLDDRDAKKIPGGLRKLMSMVKEIGEKARFNSSSIDDWEE